MKQTAFRYGIYSLITIVVLSVIHVFFLDDLLDISAQEVAGYLTMLLSMIFVFFGMKYYRDEKNNGHLSFGRGLKVGVLIVLLPAIAFGIFDVLYTRVINPDWAAEYSAQYLRQFKNLPAAEYASKKKAFDRQMELFSNPFMEFLLMSVTVFVIGFVVTIISALALRRKPQAAVNQ